MQSPPEMEELRREAAERSRMEREERLRMREMDEQARLTKALDNQAAIHATRERAKLHQELTKEKEAWIEQSCTGQRRGPSVWRSKQPPSRKSELPPVQTFFQAAKGEQVAGSW